MKRVFFAIVYIYVALNLYQTCAAYANSPKDSVHSFMAAI